MLNHAEFRAELLKVLSPVEVDKVMPLIERQLLDTKQSVKMEAISLVKTTFPDPHAAEEECTDCMMVESIAETLETYLPVDLVEEHE